jgi:hypothetical protein
MRSNANVFDGSIRFFLVACVLICGAFPALAQSSSTVMELHVAKNVTASSMGLPDYPGARPVGEASRDSSADVGFTFGDIHFRLLISKYITGASPGQVLAFYHKSLARYGEVLECEHGEAVGSVKVAKGGLTCSDDGEHRSSSDGQSPNELRAGVPERYRIVAIDQRWTDSTRFVLVYVEKPRKSGSEGSQR